MGSLIHELHVLVATADRIAGRLLADDVVHTFPRHAALSVLHDREITAQREIAELIGLSESATSRLLAGLERDGLVVTSAAGGRRQAVRLTPAGQAAWVQSDRLLTDAFAGLTQTAGVDQDAMAQQVRHLHAALTASQ